MRGQSSNAVFLRLLPLLSFFMFPVMVQAGFQELRGRHNHDAAVGQAEECKNENPNLVFCALVLKGDEWTVFKREGGSNLDDVFELLESASGAVELVCDWEKAEEKQALLKRVDARNLNGLLTNVSYFDNHTLIHGPAEAFKWAIRNDMVNFIGAWTPTKIGTRVFKIPSHE